jgi:hypothetical protein
LGARTRTLIPYGVVLPPYRERTGRQCLGQVPSIERWNHENRVAEREVTKLR